MWQIHTREKAWWINLIIIYNTEVVGNVTGISLPISLLFTRRGRGVSMVRAQDWLLQCICIATTSPSLYLQVSCGNVGDKSDKHHYSTNYCCHNQTVSEFTNMQKGAAAAHCTHILIVGYLVLFDELFLSFTESTSHTRFRAVIWLSQCHIKG